MIDIIRLRLYKIGDKPNKACRNGKTKQSHVSEIMNGKSEALLKIGREISRLFPILPLVINEVKSLSGVKWEACIGRNEWHMVGNSLCNDKMVRGIVVFLSLIELQFGIRLIVLFVKVGNTDTIFIFDGTQQVKRRFPPSPYMRFAVP